MTKPTAEMMFWMMANRHGPIPEHRPELGPCWLWTGPISEQQGYGRLHHDSRRSAAHRFAYALLIGPIPRGLVIDHLCRVHACVNPAHLEAVTDGVNVLRGIGISAVNARKTHCIHGHEFTPENTYVSPRGTSRQCRICRGARTRKWQARQRALG